MISRTLVGLILLRLASGFGFPEFPEFKNNYHKHYRNRRDERSHEASYRTNQVFVAEHNRLFNNGRSLYKMGVNFFADMKHEDFVRMTSGVKKEPSKG